MSVILTKALAEMSNKRVKLQCFTTIIPGRMISWFLCFIQVFVALFLADSVLKQFIVNTSYLVV